MIAAEGREITKLIETTFAKESEFEIVAKLTKGEEVVEQVIKQAPDIIILDLILPGKDGFTILEELKEKNIKTRVIVVSAMSQEIFITRSIELGASYYLIKPFDAEVLLNRTKMVLLKKDGEKLLTEQSLQSDIEAVVPRVKNSKLRALEEKITNIFITVGIPAHIKGYQFLREAIKLAVDNPEIINNITKKLYPSIADRYATSSSKVERAIRHAIEVAWNRGKIENINSLFGVKVYSNNDKPTNGEFIALVADKMLLEGA